MGVCQNDGPFEIQSSARRSGTRGFRDSGHAGRLAVRAPSLRDCVFRSQFRKAAVNTELQNPVSEQLLRRICSEFSEMPGLRLTRPQARRLWGLDEETCTRILHVLVEAKFLCLTGLDMYGRLTEGPVPFPRLRIAKADIDPCPALAVKEGV